MHAVALKHTYDVSEDDAQFITVGQQLCHCQLSGSQLSTEKSFLDHADDDIDDDGVDYDSLP